MTSNDLEVCHYIHNKKWTCSLLEAVKIVSVTTKSQLSLWFHRRFIKWYLTSNGLRRGFVLGRTESRRSHAPIVFGV